MSEYYVRDMRRKGWVSPRGKHYYSRKWTPVTYGPFASAEQAEAWRALRGVTHGTIVTQRELDTIPVALEAAH